jgi:hypothetical protein
MRPGERCEATRCHTRVVLGLASVERRLWPFETLDDVIAIGDLYRFDRFAVPAALRDHLQQRYPELLAAC